MSTVQLDERRVSVRDIAPEPGAEHLPVLVFLHEGLGSAESWGTFAEDARAACGGPRTVCYSRPGYGRSDPVAPPWPLDYMHREAVEVLPRLLEELGVRRPLLVGHSDGATIALQHAAEGFPVAGLALLAPHVFVEDRTVEGIRAAAERYREGDLRAGLARRHADPDATFHGWSGVWLDPAFRGWDITASLAAITAPVLLVQGDDDAYGSTAQLDAIEAGVRGPARTVLLPGVGHVPHREAAEDTLRELAAFMVSCGVDRATIPDFDNN